MIEDFYSYTQEQDDDNVISYFFITSNGSYYYVYFDPYQYDEYIGTYPDLLASGYGFGFHRSSKGRGAWVKDPKIGATISKIIFDFIEEYGDEVVLLYHCDFADKKQKGRDKKFHLWYESSTMKDSIIKKRLEINQVDKNGKQISFYLGYLTSNANPQREQVENEFSLFADNLVAK